ncbi:hypothetical protein PBCV1_A057aR [Paramecium bursaria Chlorella virus 1]|uniref:Uncharacterized protein n=1 Tax=Paramecium bursaria Chlorella virus 1 TaxID=10506 RepID=F8TTW3_PBCV1|nr:hypothetical protein PBCV1_A057aR [Paramecium bursaria Chlorella virus 1]AEI70024.1 hypothetical protein [Paramecium bursaria Chlorella virus 1]
MNGRPFIPAIEFALPINKEDKVVIENRGTPLVFTTPGVIELNSSGIGTGDFITVTIKYETSSIDWTINEMNDYGVGIAFIRSDGEFFNVPHVWDDGDTGYDIVLRESQRRPMGRNIEHTKTIQIPEGPDRVEIALLPMFGWMNDGVHDFVQGSLTNVELSIEINVLTSPPAPPPPTPAPPPPTPEPTPEPAPQYEITAKFEDHPYLDYTQDNANVKPSYFNTKVVDVNIKYDVDGVFEIPFGCTNMTLKVNGFDLVTDRLRCIHISLRIYDDNDVVVQDVFKIPQSEICYNSPPRAFEYMVDITEQMKSIVFNIAVNPGYTLNDPVVIESMELIFSNI